MSVRPVLVSVNGTAAPNPFDPGFSGQMNDVLTDPWNDIFAQFVGPEAANIYIAERVGYPAATFPMGPSVQQGVLNALAQINRYPVGTPLFLSGYSQGALVTDFLWRDHLLPSNRAKDVIGMVNFGDPMRCPGICRGNELAGVPVPVTNKGVTSGGIAGPGDLKPEETPDWVFSCNNIGDLFGDAPVGDTPWTQETGVGHDETLIFNLVQNFDGPNVLAIVKEVIALLGISSKGFDLTALITGVVTGTIEGLVEGLANVPLGGATTPNHVVALVEALLNAGMFFGSGWGPHYDYGKFFPAVTDFAYRVGKAAYRP